MELTHNEAYEIISEYDIKEAVQIFMQDYGMDYLDANLLYDMLSSCI